MKKIIINLLIVSILFVFAIPVTAQTPIQENEGIELTIQQAIDMAINHSNVLKQAELDIERNKEISQSANEKVKYIPSGPSSHYAGQVFTAAVAAQISWQMSKKAKTLQEDQLVLTVINEYTDVLKAQRNLEVAQAVERNALNKWKLALLSYQEGIISDTQHKAAHTQYKLALQGVEAAEIDLNIAYQNLNKTIGLQPSERPVLVEKPAFEAADLDPLEVLVQRAIDGNPAVWLAEQNVNLAELQLELYDWTNPMREPYETKKIDVRKAEINASDTRTQMKQLVMVLYNNILKLENAYITQSQAIALQEEQLRVLKTKYELGMVTKQDVEEVEIEIVKAKKSLEQIAYQHEILKMAIEKPWAYAAAISAGSQGHN